MLPRPITGHCVQTVDFPGIPFSFLQLFPVTACAILFWKPAASAWRREASCARTSRDEISTVTVWACVIKKQLHFYHFHHFTASCPIQRLYLNTFCNSGAYTPYTGRMYWKNGCFPKSRRPARFPARSYQNGTAYIPPSVPGRI